MSNVALVTAKVVEASNADRDMEPSLRALGSLGIEAAAPCWDDPAVAWEQFHLVIVRSTWDYVHRCDEFLDWLTRTEKCARVLNPSPIVRWSLDKHYLQDLAAQDIPIVPTAFFEPGRPVALPDWSGEIVVKPAIGAEAKDAARHASSSAATRHAEQLAAQGRSAIVQPYLATVETNGETGLVYFNGRFSHAFEKAALLETGVARPSVELFAAEATTPRMASDDELALGSSVLAAIDADLLYARVDMLPDSKGAPVVLEVELAEPSFFLHTHDGAADAFARAVQERL